MIIIDNDNNDAASSDERAYNQLLERADYLATDIAENGIHIACQKGCDHCCKGTPVGITRPDAYKLVAHYLTRPAAEQVFLYERLEKQAATERSSNGEVSGYNTPCALLDAEGACTVYADRPSACRGCASSDRAFCEDSFTAETAPSGFKTADNMALALSTISMQKATRDWARKSENPEKGLLATMVLGLITQA
jgi:Fe-S-cluster containining protein